MVVQSCYITSYITLLNYNILLKWGQEYLQRLREPLYHDTFGKLRNGKGKVIPALSYVPHYENVRESRGMIPRILNFSTW
jgi:hypothetical protein